MNYQLIQLYLLAIMFMPYLFIFVAVAMLQACFTKEPFDEYEFEKTTGMEFPVKYAVTETYNNTDGRISVVIKADTASLADFLRHYHFDTLKNLQDTIHIIENFIQIINQTLQRVTPFFIKMVQLRK